MSNHKHYSLACRACHEVIATCGCAGVLRPTRYSLEVCEKCVSGGFGDGVPAPPRLREPTVQNGKAQTTVLVP